MVSFASAVALGVGLFGLTAEGLVVAMVKGLLLALVVLLVVWSALLLYSLVDRVGAVESIGAAMVNATQRPALRALMIAWGFSGFLQGFAGFGAPVASVVPLLKVAGFKPIPSVAAAMVGHSWAITFGSMGSSFLAIILVTRIPGETVAPWIAALFVLPILVTGISVLHILLAGDGIRQGTMAVLVVGAAMSAAMWLLATLGVAPIAATVPALLGCLLIWLMGRRYPPTEPVAAQTLPFHFAFLPYYLLIAITLVSQLGPGARVTQAVTVGLDLPATATLLGYAAPAEANFPRLRILAHPASVIVLAIVGMLLVYGRAGRWPAGTLSQALQLTYRRSTASSIAVSFMVMMALVMTDSGMTRALADGIRGISGSGFPLLSPFLGVLGAFMTGSNTNSNVTMGALQVETAAALGLTLPLIAAAQTVGGSLGAGVSPDKAAIGAAVAGVAGQEAAISLKALPYTFAAVALVALEVFILAVVLPR